MNARDPAPAPRLDAGAPHVALLLIGYNQESLIAGAVAAALAQDYEPLTVVVSDDASTDRTYEVMCRAVATYAGPHRVILNRNPRNLGIGAHLSHAAALCPDAELLVIAAGDDESLPQRCRRVAEAWLTSGRRVDLIASALQDMDAQGQVLGTVRPSDLSRYKDLRDWAQDPPHVVGAAQAWTRRLLDRFGPLPEGVVAEDLVMVMRAIGSGGALTLDEPLVRYRRGGLSGRVRKTHASQVIERLKKNSRHALVELPLMLRDAQAVGQLDAVEPVLAPRLCRERFIHEAFAAPSLGARLRAIACHRAVPWSVRLRVGTYAACPQLLAPWFWLRRALRRR